MCSPGASCCVLQSGGYPLLTPPPHPPSCLRVLLVFHLSKQKTCVRHHINHPTTRKKKRGLRRIECSPVVTASVLSHLHQLLAEYFLHQGSPNRGLDHFSELMACTTNEDSRRQLVNEFRRTDDYHRATAGLTHSNVEAMLDEVRELALFLYFFVFESKCRLGSKRSVVGAALLFFWFQTSRLACRLKNTRRNKQAKRHVFGVCWMRVVRTWGRAGSAGRVLCFACCGYFVMFPRTLSVCTAPPVTLAVVWRAGCQGGAGY